MTTWRQQLEVDAHVDISHEKCHAKLRSRYVVVVITAGRPETCICGERSVYWYGYRLDPQAALASLRRHVDDARQQLESSETRLAEALTDPIHQTREQAS